MLQWEEKYNTGIEIIDQQHQKIVEYINALSDILEREGPLDASAAQSVIHDVIEYTASHFDFEEKLMEKAKYPLKNAHKKRHDSFIRRVQGYNNRFQNGDEKAIAEFCDLLKVWLIHHIQRDDQVYSRRIRERIDDINITLL